MQVDAFDLQHQGVLKARLREMVKGGRVPLGMAGSSPAMTVGAMGAMVGWVPVEVAGSSSAMTTGNDIYRPRYTSMTRGSSETKSIEPSDSTDPSCSTVTFTSRARTNAMSCSTTTTL